MQLKNQAVDMLGWIFQYCCRTFGECIFN